MTPTQRRLARQALGLPNDRNRSYRNRFYCSCGPQSRWYSEWLAMRDSGWARCDLIIDNMRLFWLTRAGAEAALDLNETLCPEDFPE